MLTTEGLHECSDGLLDSLPNGTEMCFHRVFPRKQYRKSIGLSDPQQSVAYFCKAIAMNPS